MKKSLKTFTYKLQEMNNGQLMKGFAILKSLRGGVMSTNSASQCENSKTCSGTNKISCLNTGDCSQTTNSSYCSNSGTACLI